MFDKDLHFQLNAMARAVNQAWDDGFRRLGLSPAHAGLLRLILEEPGLTQNEAAEKLVLNPSTVSRFVDALVRQELAIRKAKASDSRSSPLHPTDKARELQPELDETSRRLQEKMVAALGKKAGPALVESLAKARKRLRKE